MTDPMPRWEGYTHREMYDIVHTGPGREITETVEQLWADVEALVLRIEQQIEGAITGTAGTWAGSAAEASRAAMTPLGLWALDAAGDARLVVEAIAGQAWQSVYLRAAMPEPHVPITVAGGGGFYPHGIPDEQANDVAEVNLTARAADLMNNYTNMSYVSEGYLFSSTFPPQVTMEPAAAGSAGPGGWSGPRQPGVGIEPAVVGPPPGSGSLPGLPGGPGVPGLPVPGGPGGLNPAVPGLPAPVAPTVVAPPPDGSTDRRTGDGRVGPGEPRSTPPPGGPGPAGVPPPGRGNRPPRQGAPPSSWRDLQGARPSVDPRTPGGVRPVVPGPPPRGVPAPTWRDLVARHGGPDRGHPVGGPGGNRAGGETPGRPGVPPPASEQSSRGSRSGHPALIPPMMAGAGGGQDRERRRPAYLVDDTDAFADDRYFTPQVLTPDDPLPPRGGQAHPPGH